MSFAVFTDACSNLPTHLLEELQIRMLPCSYVLDGVPNVYDGNIEAFDFHGFYEKMRSGSVRSAIIRPHEPFTGAHVGPGMLALYFFGDHR